MRAASVKSSKEHDPYRREPEVKPPRPTRAKVQRLSNRPINLSEVQRVRRDNLQLLLALQGTKAQFARLFNMSPSGVTHRVGGDGAVYKSIDSDHAAEYERVLGLPPKWFDAPQSVVPDKALELLLQRPDGTLRPKQEASRPRKKPGPRPAAKTVASAPVVMAAAPQLPPAAPAPVRTTSAPAPQSVPRATQESGALSPVAQALVNILTLKARQGRVPDAMALELLERVSVL